MKIDFHVHTRERSACGRSPARAMVRAAIRAGLDALVFTDHDRLAPLDELARLNAEFAPFRVFSGVEVTLLEGGHVMVLGVHDHALESVAWTYSDLHRFVRERAGYLVLNHPYRDGVGPTIDLARYTPDAIEVYSFNTPLEAEGRILELAGVLGMQVLSNSDAHHADRIGTYWSEVTGGPIHESALVAALRSSVRIGGRG
jgi:predicted metal-dependent phosphoesterase TrpH